MELADRDSLVAALQDTIRSIHDKRTRGQVQPLKNHNYLKQVLATVAPEARKPAAEADNHRPNVIEKKQGLEETPEQAQAAWRRDLIKRGIDPDQFTTNRKTGV